MRQLLEQFEPRGSIHEEVRHDLGNQLVGDGMGHKIFKPLEKAKEDLDAAFASAAKEVAALHRMGGSGRGEGDIALRLIVPKLKALGDITSRIAAQVENAIKGSANK